MAVKDIIEAVKSNKEVIIKKTLIIGGSAVALALAAGLLNGFRPEGDVIQINETLPADLDTDNL